MYSNNKLRSVYLSSVKHINGVEQVSNSVNRSVELKCKWISRAEQCKKTSIS